VARTRKGILYVLVTCETLWSKVSDQGKLNLCGAYQGGQSSLYQLFLFYIKTIKHYQLTVTEVVISTHFWVFVEIFYKVFHAMA
jgi:hypothetical protein